MKTLAKVLSALAVAVTVVVAAAALIDRAYGRRPGHLWRRLCRLLGIDCLCRWCCRHCCDCDDDDEFDDDWDPWSDWDDDDDDILDRIHTELKADFGGEDEDEGEDKTDGGDGDSLSF